MRSLLYQRLLHDCSVAAAHVLVGTTETVIRPEERLDAFNEFYVIVRTAIEKYCEEYQKMMGKLHPLTPSDN